MVQKEQEKKPSFIRFAGKYDFSRLLCECIIDACENEENQLILSDPDFSSWPLSEETLIQALNSWANSYSNRRVMDFVAGAYHRLAEQHDAWVLWRRRWSHRVHCWETSAELPAPQPSIFWSDHCVLILNQSETFSGFVSRDRMRIVQARSQLDEILHYSQPAFPAVTLGL